MSSIPSLFNAVVLSVDVVVICTLMSLYAHQSMERVSDKEKRRWHISLRLLMLVPAFVLLIVAFLIVGVWKAEPAARFVHALVVLSLWMPVTFMVSSLLFTARDRLSALILPATIFILAGAPILQLTSIDRFRAVFDPIGYGLPFVIGLSALGFVYKVLFALNKKFSRSTASGDNSTLRQAIENH
jgi:hypothetical protein